MLEVIGNHAASAGLRYSLYIAAGNVAIGYVTSLDGSGAALWGKHFGDPVAARGFLAADGLQNLLGVAALLLASTARASAHRKCSSFDRNHLDVIDPRWR